MEIIHKYFPKLDARKTEQLSHLQALYTEWNGKINVVSRKDIDSLYERHVLHSLAIAKHLQFPAGSTILDIGTGGGFPGIPLAILFPESNFILVDSIGKKILVAQEIGKAIGLTNMQARKQRAEEVTERFDYIVSRAVAEFGQLFAWTNKKFKREPLQPADTQLGRGYIVLKGGDLHEELEAFKNKTSITPLSDYFEEEFFETKKIVYMPAPLK